MGGIPADGTTVQMVDKGGRRERVGGSPGTNKGRWEKLVLFSLKYPEGSSKLEVQFEESSIQVITQDFWGPKRD